MLSKFEAGSWKLGAGRKSYFNKVILSFTNYLQPKTHNLLPIAFFLLPIISSAQCAMCRASLESSGNQTQAEAVNDGIVYLMIIPYVLIGLVGVFIYRMYRKKKTE